MTISEANNEKMESGFEVKYLGDYYEIKNFLRNHPGGLNYVEGYKGKDVGKRMEETAHSKSAFYLLREYKTGGRGENPNKDTEDLEVTIEEKFTKHGYSIRDSP